ncbi:spinster family MFS transporter [Steroidobacter agaridevorans]|uniref:spinster family MFS transporter n=1 Tax=Steroidobacter agaridevorans TaxID=2695856 RepID=UPI00132A89CE|nr:MFS transporter [Steroidobacter agaridevorans]GFE91910.1 MFS transporter [Steroidobacter agaridevorans]
MTSNAYRRYVLGALAVTFAFVWLDRSLIMLLLQPIKEDLRVSDAQLGFVSGIAFALFYATVGLPISRWADTGNRVSITSIAIATWGVTVSMCLFVGNFFHLVVARVFAAVGEAGCMPPTYSLLGDYFPKPAERARAMSVYWIAAPIAPVLGFIAGGYVAERYGWRMTFLLAGLLALLVAIVFRMTVRDPRMNASSLQAPPQQPRRFVDVGRALWNRASSRHLTIGMILFFTMAQGMNPWYAAFMMRSHGMSTSELGVWLGMIFAIGGVAGTWLGGYVVARWYADNERGQIRLISIMVASLAPWFILFLLLPRKEHTLAVLFPLIVAFNFFNGPIFAMLQRLVADEMRARALAVVMMLANLIGMGIGPQLIGIFSDLLMPRLGPDSLRYAMLGTSLITLWAAHQFWQVSHTVKSDLSDVAQRARYCPDAAQFPAEIDDAVRLR